LGQPNWYVWSWYFQSEVSYGAPDKLGGESETTIDKQDTHLFTPQEASKLLPDVKPKVKELIERKKVVAKLHSEIEKYNLLGFKTAEVVERAAQLDALVEDMTRKIAELEDLGSK